MIDDLIFDIGMHKGEDTEFYLAKGFRVVAVDADPMHCDEVSRRLKSHIQDGRLTILNCAIAKQAGKVSFYRNLDLSVWGTIETEWIARNARLGKQRIEKIEVDAITMDEIFRSHGVPYFMKVDIEGCDLLCLEALKACPSKPRYLSVESNKVSFAAVRHEFQLMQELGYRDFKIVPQHEVESQVPPVPGREGKYVDHRFEDGASGLFGEEAPGIWEKADASLRRYAKIFWRYRLVGDNPWIKSYRIRAMLAKRGFVPGWHDTHARLGEGAV